MLAVFIAWGSDSVQAIMSPADYRQKQLDDLDKDIAIIEQELRESDNDMINIYNEILDGLKKDRDSLSVTDRSL